MKGYYDKEHSANGSGIPTGRLKIEVMNLPEFNALLEQAKSEADQLQKTINRLENFELNIDFEVKESILQDS